MVVAVDASGESKAGSRSASSALRQARAVRCRAAQHAVQGKWSAALVRVAQLESQLLLLQLGLVSDFELFQKIAMSAPVLNADMCGVSVNKLDRARRNIAAHNFNVLASAISIMDQRAANSTQRAVRFLLVDACLPVEMLGF